MPKLAMTSSLDKYPCLPIKEYRKQLNDTAGNVTGVTVSYSYHGKDYQYTIATTKTDCNYGGHRYWWECPKCSRRVSVLYCVGSYVCRHCVGLGYQSQLEQPLDRLFRRIWALKRRLGADIGSIEDVPPRPKGMHQSTYDKLVDEHIRLSGQIMRTQLQILGIK